MECWQSQDGYFGNSVLQFQYVVAGTTHLQRIHIICTTNVNTNNQLTLSLLKNHIHTHANDGLVVFYFDLPKATCVENIEN